MKLPASVRAVAHRIAMHEAGHYVAARVLGFRTGGLSLQLTDTRGGHTGTTEMLLATALGSVTEISDYLRRRTQTLYAGALSEAMTLGKIDYVRAIQFIRQGGAFDWAKARELVHIIRSIEFGPSRTEVEIQEQLTALDLEVWNAAATVVEAEHQTIEAVANVLFGRVESIGVLYEMTESELTSIPAVISRFGAGDLPANGTERS